MKIYYVSNTNLPTHKAHGLAVMKMCEALARAGNDVELIVPKRRNRTKGDPFEYYGIQTKFPVRFVPTLDIKFGRIGFIVQELTFALNAARYVRGGLVYGRDDVVLAALSLLGVRRFVWESHTGAWNIAARFVARRALMLVVISRGLKDFYVQRGISADLITVFPSAITLEQFAHPETKEAARHRLGLPQDATIVLYIGGIDGWKGTDTLLEASTQFPAGTSLAMIGGDEQQVKRLQPRFPNVTFLGYRPYAELADNQAAADILTVPNTAKDVISAHFTSPLKVVAHMASMRPIVASDLPSIRELTGDDAALLVKADDPTLLAEGIRRLLSDQALGVRLAARAREKVEGYTWDARAKIITEAIQKHL